MDESNTSSSLTKKERRELKKQQKVQELKDEKRGKFVGKLIMWVIGVAIVITLFAYVKKAASIPQTNLPLPELTALSEQDHIKGATESGRLLVEYSDFQCPACAAYHPIIKKLLTDHTDSVEFVYRNFPLKQTHKNAQLSAQAAEAAGKQGKFWEMHDVLFDRQESWSESNNAQELFLEYAKELELNQEQFIAGIHSSEIIDKVNADYASGVQADVRSTPTFYLNGKKMDTFRSYDELLKLLGIN